MTNNKKQQRSKKLERSEFLEHYRPEYIKYVCRELRKHPTKSEEILWQALRNRKLAGLKFYRQHPFGRSVVDFYCHEKRLVVEIDGGIHRKTDIQEYDRMRQEMIEGYGVRFYRCTSEDVENNLDSVLEGILEVGTHPLYSRSEGVSTTQASYPDTIVPPYRASRIRN